MIEFLVGDCIQTMRTLAAGSVQTVVTSPPYFSLRDYGGIDGQIGQESDPEVYITNLVNVFREVRRVLTDDGTVWLNLGDSYAGSGSGPQGGSGQRADRGFTYVGPRKTGTGLKKKDRMMIPARVAIALQADGWWLRDEIVWHKPRTTPYPAIDRTVAAHEMVYLLTKRPTYFFDWAAIEEPSTYGGLRSVRGALNRNHGFDKAKLLKAAQKHEVSNQQDTEGVESYVGRDTRRKRSVWSISPQPYKDGHFATMPSDLADLCVRAGSRVGDVVLDPFGGAGTTALAAREIGRRTILCEINPGYVRLAKGRLGVPFSLSDVLSEAEEARDLLTGTLA